MTRNSLKSAMRRNAGDLGETVTIRNYDFGQADDRHGDSKPEERPASPHTDVPANVVTSDRDGTDRDSGATRPDTTLEVFLPDDHDAVDQLAGGPANAPRSRITRSNGQVLAVQAFTDQGNGLLRTTCEVL